MKLFLIVIGVLITMLIPSRASEAGMISSKTVASLNYILNPKPPKPIEIKIVKSQDEIEAKAERLRVEKLEAAKKASFALREPIPRINPGRAEIIATAREMVKGSWAGEDQWNAFNAVVTRESGWNPNAVNPTSGSCGLPQALPCSKLKDKSINGQISWTINYIRNRYSDPIGALKHSNQYGWY